MRDDPIQGRIALSFERMNRLGGIRHVFSTRDKHGKGNVSLSGNRDQPLALAERAFWSTAIGVDGSSLVVGGQVHGNACRWVGMEEKGRGAISPDDVLAQTDALLTKEPQLPLYSAVADCAAVLFFAPGVDPMLGLAHAGWRGLHAGILTKVCAELSSAEADLAQVYAGVSPCIGLHSFGVGEEVADLAPANRRVKLDGQWHVDLAGWAHHQLAEAGLHPSHIETAGLDTADRADLFFSHRRDGEETGRMALFATLG